jgi:uncharacterized membrane protein
VGSIDTFVIVFLVTGNIAISGSIGLAEILTKTILFYAHERMWVRVLWGREYVASPIRIAGFKDKSSQND